MKKIYGYTIGGIFALMPIIMLITYITYTEKIVMPILLIIMIICGIKLRKEIK